MTRVLYITRAKLSLTRAHNRNILKTADALARIAGFRVRVIALLRTNTDPGRIRAVHNISSVDIFGTFSLLFYIVRNHRKYDILFFRDVRLVFHALIARVLGKKVIFEIHGNHEWRLLTWMWRFAYHVAHGSIFITQRLQAWYGISKPGIVLFPSASDFEICDAARRMRNVVRSELGVTDKQVLIVYSGGTLWYDLRWVVDLPTYLPPYIKLLIVGPSTQEADTLREYAKSKGLSERVIVRSRVHASDVPTFLVAGDILLNA